MNIIGEREYNDRYNITWLCPHGDLEISLTAKSKAEALRMADELWGMHKAHAHKEQ